MIISDILGTTGRRTFGDTSWKCRYHGNSPTSKSRNRGQEGLNYADGFC